MKHLKLFEDIQNFDFIEDWEEEDDSLIWDKDMLEYLIIMTANSSISHSKPYIDNVKDEKFDQLSTYPMAYVIVISLLKKINNLNDDDKKWLENLNNIVNHKNASTCGFNFDYSIKSSITYHNLNITIEKFKELYDRYYLS